MWEDEANAKGGKWVLTMKNNPVLLDRCWSFLAMALVGEELEDGDEICGAVVSLRSKVDRIQLWTRSRGDVERLNGIGKKLIKLLDVSEADGIALEFQVRARFLTSRPHTHTSFGPAVQHDGGTASPQQVPLDRSHAHHIIPVHVRSARGLPQQAVQCTRNRSAHVHQQSGNRAWGRGGCGCVWQVWDWDWNGGGRWDSRWRSRWRSSGGMARREA
jgi:hypothetical protein